MKSPLFSLGCVKHKGHEGELYRYYKIDVKLSNGHLIPFIFIFTTEEEPIKLFN